MSSVKQLQLQYVYWLSGNCNLLTNIFRVAGGYIEFSLNSAYPSDYNH